MSSILSINTRQAVQPVSAISKPVEDNVSKLSAKMIKQKETSTTVTLSAQATKSIESANGQNQVVSSAKTMINASSEAKNILGKMNDLAKTVASNEGFASKEANSELKALNKQLNDVFKSTTELFHDSSKNEQATSKKYKTGENLSVEIKSQDVSEIAKDFGTIDSSDSAQKFMRKVESALNDLSKVEDYAGAKMKELDTNSKNIHANQNTNVGNQPKVQNINDIERSSGKMNVDSMLAKYTEGSRSKFDLSELSFSQYV